MNIYTVQIDLYKLSVITMDVQRTHNEVRDNNCKTKAD